VAAAGVRSIVARAEVADDVADEQILEAVVVEIEAAEQLLAEGDVAVRAADLARIAGGGVEGEAEAIRPGRREVVVPGDVDAAVDRPAPLRRGRR
jgi:hypothetical protein